MARQARKKSESNTYHIMMRGINRQQIFEDAQDNEKFLDVLKECKDLSGFKLFAYCLMGNHLHLLIRFEDEPIEQAMKRICARFVYWYNTKYGRVGHLFQDRFKSEPIEDDQYFLSCLRYIHQNPATAKTSRIDNYPYSSYSAYLPTTQQTLVDTDELFSLVNPKDFEEFCSFQEKSTFIDTPDFAPARLTDEDAKALIFKFTKCSNVTEFQALDEKKKARFLNKLKSKGIGIRQLSRLTGESYYFIQKA